MLCSCLVWNERIYFYQVFCSEGHFAVSAGMSYSRNLKDKFQTQHEVCSVKAVPYGMTWKACQTFSPQPVSFRVSQDYVLWHNFLYLIVTGAAAERKWGGETWYDTQQKGGWNWNDDNCKPHSAPPPFSYRGHRSVLRGGNGKRWGRTDGTLV